MSYAKYITHLNLEYDTDKLKDEVKDLDFQPFNLYTKGYNEAKDAAWWIARIRENKHMHPQINNLYELLEADVIAIHRQYANTRVNTHIDPNSSCCVNIILSGHTGPVVFEDYGKIYYKCALLNSQEWHSVPSYDEDRVLVKFAYFKKSYEEVLTNLTNKSLTSNARLDESNRT
tara:strand:+ start:332 stop:853 length:522 start_codon:yes stop_codon:yes gene_type:complete